MLSAWPVDSRAGGVACGRTTCRPTRRKRLARVWERARAAWAAKYPGLTQEGAFRNTQQEAWGGVDGAAAPVLVPPGPRVAETLLPAVVGVLCSELFTSREFVDHRAPTLPLVLRGCGARTLRGWAWAADRAHGRGPRAVPSGACRADPVHPECGAAVYQFEGEVALGRLFSEMADLAPLLRPQRGRLSGGRSLCVRSPI